MVVGLLSVVLAAVLWAVWVAWWMLRAIVTGDLEASLRRRRSTRWVVLPLYRWYRRRLLKRWDLALDIASAVWRRDTGVLLRRKLTGRLVLVPVCRLLRRRWSAASSRRSSRPTGASPNAR
jgi:hypothetical protein